LVGISGGRWHASEGGLELCIDLSGLFAGKPAPTVKQTTALFGICDTGPQLTWPVP